MHLKKNLTHKKVLNTLHLFFECIIQIVKSLVLLSFKSHTFNIFPSLAKNKTASCTKLAADVTYPFKTPDGLHRMRSEANQRKAAQTK